MGCDIHIVVETKIKDRWVGTYNSGGPWYPRYEINRPESPFEQLKHRDYSFFTRVANVRGDGGLDPLGAPDDASDLTQALLQEWEGDGHSTSHMPLREFIALKLQGEDNAAGAMRTKMEGVDPVVQFLNKWFYDTEDELARSRVVFWFDN